LGNGADVHAEEKMNTKSWKEAARIALKYANVIRFCEQGMNIEEFTLDETYARDATLIVDTMEKIVRTRSELFHVVAAKGDKGSQHVKMTALGKEFLALLKKSYVSIQESFSSHKFHPLLELFNKHVREMSPACSMALPADVPFLNRAVEAIREEGKSQAFRDVRDGFVRWSRESTKSLLRYVDALFAKYSRLLVVRLDVGYRKAPGIGHPLLTHQEVSEHRKQFFQFVRRGYRARLLGYAWSLEFGRAKGFHYHLLLFFDANQVRSDYVIGEELGQFWRDVATYGMGTYHNCSRNTYTRHGLGMIQFTEKDAMTVLKENVASYLTKPCFYIRHVVKGGHTFDHGNMPKMPKVKRGRPRNLGHVHRRLLIPQINDGPPLWL
jgi:Inovirus Gp2